MSAMPARSSRCNASGPRSGRSTPSSSPIIPGYGAWTGEVVHRRSVRRLVDGIEQRGVLGRCDAVLCGYMGDPAIGEAVLDAVARVRRANPRAVYCCDPVIGDEGPASMSALASRVDARPRGPAGGYRDAQPVRARAVDGRGVRRPGRRRSGRSSRCRARMRPDGPRAVLLTSLRTKETPRRRMDLLAAEGGALPPAPHAADRARLQRRGRRDRGTFPVPSAAHRQRCRSAGSGRLLDLWPAAANGGGRLARNAA